MKSKNWTREELILAFNLYLKLPFGKMHKGNPEVINLSKLIDRTPSAVAMRLTNFASIDPFHQERGVAGLTGGRKQCQPIWDEFNENREELIYESERIIAEKESTTIETKFEKILQDISKYKGEEKVREVKTRVNQSVFRQIILGSYSGRCAISGINIPELLNASHIIPWSKNEQERLNPENGICLSKLYDATFDSGLIGIKPDYSVILSTKIKEQSTEVFYDRYFSFISGTQIVLPERYKPRKDFLEFHLDTIFKG
ncbi:MAG: HNH endonuclease [Proteobacteria bacterium]|nr:HNH endonuclease [Pseudomonadota bacterium]